MLDIADTITRISQGATLPNTSRLPGGSVSEVPSAAREGPTPSPTVPAIVIAVAAVLAPRWHLVPRFGPYRGQRDKNVDEGRV